MTDMITDSPATVDRSDSGLLTSTSVSRQRIESIVYAPMSDPLRNHLVTLCYVDLSDAMAELLGHDDANWCSLAVWPSFTVGESIRSSPTSRMKMMLAQMPFVPASLRDRLMASARLDPPDARGVMNRSLATGNRGVFYEIGMAWVDFLETFGDRSATITEDEEKFVAFSDRLMNMVPPPGRNWPEGARRQLLNGFRAYLDALQIDPANSTRRAQLILKANIFIGDHEQRRLQGWLDMSALDPIRNLTRWVGLDGTNSTVLARVEWAWNWVLTKWVFFVYMAGEKIKIGYRVPPPPGEVQTFPTPLDSLDHDVDRVYTPIIERSPGADGADWWGDIDNRMAFIATLFRSRQRAHLVGVNPYPTDDLERIVADATKVELIERRTGALPADPPPDITTPADPSGPPTGASGPSTVPSGNGTGPSARTVATEAGPTVMAADPTPRIRPTPRTGGFRPSSAKVDDLLFADVTQEMETPWDAETDVRFRADLEGARSRGDVEADAAVEEFYARMRPPVAPEDRYYTDVMLQATKWVSRIGPLGRFLAAEPELPDWADRELIDQAQAFYTDFRTAAHVGLFYGSMPLSYAAKEGCQVLGLLSTLGSTPERKTGDTVRRFWESTKFVEDVFTTPFWETGSEGWQSIRGVRLFHAAVRHTIVSGSNRIQHPPPELNGEIWDDAWGLPINQEDMLAATIDWSVATIHVMDRFGVPLDAEEAEAYYHTWLVVGYLLGVEEKLLMSPADPTRPLTLRESQYGAQVMLFRQIGASRAGRRLMEGLLGLIDEWFPGPMRRLPRAMMYTALNDEIAQVLGLSPPGRPEKMFMAVTAAGREWRRNKVYAAAVQRIVRFVGERWLDWWERSYLEVPPYRRGGAAAVYLRIPNVTVRFGSTEAAGKARSTATDAGVWAEAHDSDAHPPLPPPEPEVIEIPAEEEGLLDRVRGWLFDVIGWRRGASDAPDEAALEMPIEELPSQDVEAVEWDPEPDIAADGDWPDDGKRGRGGPRPPETPTLDLSSPDLASMNAAVRGMRDEALAAGEHEAIIEIDGEPLDLLMLSDEEIDLLFPV
ncbi:MAG: oxygenase MpaB family protein [Actinomycetota bacterium]